MSLQSTYKQFLAAPNPSFLAENASLHYITTLVTLNGANEIAKHLKNQALELKKKEEKFLDAVEGQNALAVEVHTTVEFLTGGGAYLPSLDDNFLADRIVTFPIIHIVTFDGNGKIVQIRQSWDQGSLLKLIDVIGRTGRNWPIRDGKDQIKLILSSVKSTGQTSVEAQQPEVVDRSRSNSSNVTRDPHASLSLFAPRSKNTDDSLPAIVAPRASAKPPPRDYHDLFVGNDSDNSPASPSKGARATDRTESPSRPPVIPSKSGAGKNYGPSRLFEVDDDDVVDSPVRPSPPKDHSAEHFYRPNPKKYQHFDFADGSEAQDVPKQAPLKKTESKHGSQWSFDDFATPQKNVPTKVLRNNDIRHWGNSDDEVEESPVKIKKENKPRKDAETHFEFIDDGTPEGQPRLIGRPRGAGQNTGLGLYKNNLYDDDNGGTAGGDEPRTINTIANTKDRRKDFDPSFSMTDDSPASKPSQQQANREDRAKVIKMMDANWTATDASPSQKENVPTSPTASRPNTGTGKGPLSESTNTMSNRNDNPRGIVTAGDGMGGKKGTGRQWGFGDDSDVEVELSNKPSKYRTGKTQGKNQATGGDFWDF